MKVPPFVVATARPYTPAVTGKIPKSENIRERVIFATLPGRDRWQPLKLGGELAGAVELLMRVAAAFHIFNDHGERLLPVEIAPELIAPITGHDDISVMAGAAVSFRDDMLKRGPAMPHGGFPMR